MFSLAIILLCSSVYAADDAYSFDINYTGDIIEDEDKNATVILQATEGTTYSNVRIKVEFLSGPAQPTIIAYDTTGTGYNIVEIGYWGPETGFAVGGTFKNETPVVATYPEAGTYVVRLSLLDLNNQEQVITSKEFTQTVLSATSTEIANNVAENMADENAVIDEIPQTGTSIWVYLSVILVTIGVIYVVSRRLKNK